MMDIDYYQKQSSQFNIPSTFKELLGSLNLILFTEYHGFEISALNTLLNTYKEISINKLTIEPLLPAFQDSETMTYCRKLKSDLTLGDFLILIKKSFNYINNRYCTNIKNDGISFCHEYDKLKRIDFYCHFSVNELEQLITLSIKEINNLIKKAEALKIKCELLESIIYQYGEDESGYRMTSYYSISNYQINIKQEEIITIDVVSTWRADTSTTTSYEIKLDKHFYEIFKAGFSEESLKMISLKQ